jgi:hypothetical protein
MKKPKSDPNQIFVGTYTLGHEEVDLYALPNEGGGYFYFIPEEGKRARIKVGMRLKRWPQVVEVLMHEAVEFSLTREGHRFEASKKFNSDAAWYTFMFTHDQFGHVMACAADFITPALPALAKVYKKHKP